MSPEPADIDLQDIIPVRVLEKCLSKWAKHRGSRCLPCQLQSFRAVDTQPQHSSISPICMGAFCQQVCIPVPCTTNCPWPVTVPQSTPELLHGAPSPEGDAHSCIPKGILATYSQLKQCFKEQKDGMWFMKFPPAVPHPLKLLHASCEGSDPQDQMDTIFPSFSFKAGLWKTVPQQRINSAAVPFEYFIFKNHCCQLVPKMSIKEEWKGKIRQHCWKCRFSCS